MLNRCVCVVVLLIAACQLSFAQYKFSSDPAVFVQDVGTMMANTKNPQAIEAGNSFGTTLASFSADQQKKIIETVQKLGKSKKIKAHPHFTDFFVALGAAKNKNIQAANLDTLLIVTDKIAETYEGRSVQAYLTLLRDFFEKGLLYKSSYNKLRVSGGEYSFRLIEPGAATAYEDTEINTTQEDTQSKTVLDAQKDFFSDWDIPWDQEDGGGTMEDYSEPDVLEVGYLYPIQPKIEGAVLELRNADLTFITQNDSSATIKGANGALLFQKGIFVGNGGTMSWPASDASESISATLREYNFPVKSIHVLSEGAMLSYQARTDSLVEGVFEYKENKNKNNPTFPRFKSFKSNIDVRGLGENIVYKGGLSLMGPKVFSSSIDDGFSMIEIHKNGYPVIRSFSNRFELGDSVISANVATLALYIDNDSVTHPGTSLRFNKNNSILRVAKQSGYHQAPFIDSYHNLEIISDVIVWDLNRNDIDFNIVNAKNHIPATFESDEYYHADKFFKLKGAYRFHPLQVIVGYADKNRTDMFYAGDVAEPLKIELNTFKGAMVQLMKLGYIDYNTKTGLIKLREKARHYVLSSRSRKDYDNITFVSLSPGAVNASLNLETYELYVRGVERIYISDSLKVNITPDNKEIKIQKNRNFKFNGNINTENFQFVGKEFEFVYDSFLVHMPQIDQIKLAVVNNKKKGSKDTSVSKSRVLGNELRYSSGTLYINKPDNKSARKKLAQYPIFDATSGASVFFNKKNINGGVYDTTVQFQIPPFRLDSLSSDDPHTIGFDGTFKSGGIFPEFKEKLVVMPDYSLGFKHQAPKDGYQLYEGTGKYYSSISLDNKGIRGDGEIRYLSTTLWSKDFVFFKDSVKTEGTKVQTKPGTHPDAEQSVTFPKMNVTEYRLKWLPRQDSMLISNVKTPLAFYDSTATMIGTANVTKKGMLGKGVVFTRGSVTESYQVAFEQKRFGARNAKFKIESEDPEIPALQGIDVKLDFDLEKELVKFGPEVEGFASNSFPYVQYRSSLQEGEWDLKKKVVNLAMPEGGDLSKSYFYSTRPDQDSLVYNATHAVYDIPAQTLNISGIPLIKVADAHIFPDSGHVVIEQNAVMRTLKNAKIEIDTVKKYHHLYDGSIDILSRHKFGGVATYQYVNLGDDTLAIKFQDFRLEAGRKKKDGMHTVATGMVKEDDNLFIGPKIIYKGKVVMYAESPYLVFDGYLKLDLKGALSYSEWLKYVNDGEDKQVKIDLQNAVSDNGVPLSTGIHFDKRSNQLYTSFISRKVAQTDPDFFVADKSFEYNLDSNEFRVGNPERFLGKTYQGNNLRYDDSSSTIHYAGKFTLLHMEEKNTNVKLISTGAGQADLNENDYSFNTLLAFNFNLHSKITTAMAGNMKGVAEYLPPDTSAYSPEKQMAYNENLYGKIAAIVGQTGLNTYKTKQSMGTASINAINSELGKSFTFSNVDLKWSPEYKAFYSVGLLELAGIQKTEIKKTIKGYIEIRKTGKGDVVNIYMEPTPHNWQYITYSDNRLAAITSNEDVNNVIRGRSKGEMPDRSKFYFVAAEPIEKQRFLQDFRSHYLNQSVDEIEEEDAQIEQEQEEFAQPEQNEIDLDEPEIGEEEQKKAPIAPPPAKGKKGKKQKEPNYDQYKLPDQDNDIDLEDEKEEKQKPTIEDQQQKKQDQQKMKDLFR
jgi:hypothetical protein